MLGGSSIHLLRTLAASFTARWAARDDAGSLGGPGHVLQAAAHVVMLHPPLLN